MDEKAPVPFKQYFPKLSMSSYFWVVIGISALFFGILGYFIGVRVNQLPLPLTQQLQLTPSITTTPGADSDANVAKINGLFTTDTNFYSQIAINIDSIQNGVKTNLDSDFRDITKPQAGVVYPFLFSRLDSSKIYSVSISACRANPKTFALECAKNIKVTSCSGTIQGSSCLIKWQGNPLQHFGGVDFSLSKADNPIPK
jgi:hypothetical protein